jgi:hypothetical protein
MDIALEQLLEDDVIVMVLQSALKRCPTVWSVHVHKGAHFLWYKQFNYVLGSCKAWLLFLDHYTDLKGQVS